MTYCRVEHGIAEMALKSDDSRFSVASDFYNTSTSNVLVRVPPILCALNLEDERMANDPYTKIIDGLWNDYLSLGPHTETIVRKVRKTSNGDIRSKLIAELRSLDRKRLELLDQIDDMAKSKSGA